MNRLKSYRERKRLTQAQLGKELGVSAQAIAKWESGESYPSAQKLPALADLLGCSIDELFGRTANESD